MIAPGIFCVRIACQMEEKMGVGGNRLQEEGGSEVGREKDGKFYTRGVFFLRGSFFMGKLFIWGSFLYGGGWGPGV